MDFDSQDNKNKGSPASNITSAFKLKNQYFSHFFNVCVCVCVFFFFFLWGGG